MPASERITACVSRPFLSGEGISVSSQELRRQRITVRSIKLALVALVLSACVAAIGGRASADGEHGGYGAVTAPPVPRGLFSPSNARTEDGKLIPEAQFFPAARCASCHQDTHAGWSESLHRNAGREPFYKESVDILLRTRGIEFTRHCESCHAPVALLSGALTKGSQESRRLDDEGVTCSVCHSITEARLDGTGSYTIRRPALIARQDGTPVYGDVSDEQILTDVAGHRRAMMRPLLRQPEFCASCHKSSAPPELNDYKFTRGFSTYDEWQQSGASHETVAPFYRRPQRTDCRDCHMPKVASADDRAAKGGQISSHRWPGANTAAPLFYRQAEQVKITENFLQANVLSLDIFALKHEALGSCTSPLDPQNENRVALTPGEEVTAEVVVANRNAAHSFPPELRDLYEAWVEFEAVDVSGKVIFHSGFLKPDGMLDESAHVYRSILLDAWGQPLLRHEVWLATIKAYDNTIPPGRSDLVRFRFRVPKDVKTGPDGAASITLRARVNYRRFFQEYTDFVLQRQQAHLSIPVVRMSGAEVKVRAGGGATTAVFAALNPPSSIARRWNDYGIGLLEQAQYGPAAEAFRQASEIDPRDPNPLTSAAIAEMKTERFGPERDQLRKAASLLDRALSIDPTWARARYFKALVLRAEGKTHAAVDELAKLAREYPRDREIARQLGQTLFALGSFGEAGAAFEGVVAIDPTDAGAYQFLDSIYASQGRKVDADRAHSLYLLWRDDPRADGVAARFFAAHPEWVDERIGAHTHGNNSPRRPVIAGAFAAPDR